MAILRIEFAGSELYHNGILPLELLVDGCLQPECALQLECARNSTGGVCDSHQVQSARVTRLIQCTNYSNTNVYQALLNNTVNVVLKLGVTPTSRARVEREADNYETHLKGFWSTIVPTYYGLYKGHGPRPGKPGNDISCLMLEYAGERLEDLESLPLEERRTILTMLAKLHFAKVHPRNFDGHNIVQRNGVYRLIHFHNINVHDCKFDGDLQWNARHSARLRCVPLQIAGQNMGIWDPEPSPEITLGVDTLAAFQYPSQQFIDAVVEPHMLEPHNAMYCHAWLRHVRIYMNEHDIPVENDHGNKELRAYADSVRPAMPITRAEAGSRNRNKPRTLYT
ncbi:hypothetical protein Hypma_005078 [Hypsizygus marmoreus]|uniref:Protein kinase domain-containing protein n=1 Tax=Hypsizygus marmoreus TaxID=39966 RepID=A0A369K7Y4_HYPMA|nr:hypothetical protein Hypma_005078 [Hypsizygus marmoreus]